MIPPSISLIDMILANRRHKVGLSAVYERENSCDSKLQIRDFVETFK
jgi:hypothetical protein